MHISESDIGFDPITPEILRTDKQFVKLLKKQQKEIELLKKKHNKDRPAMQKQHCIVVDKLVVTHDKEKVSQEKSLEKAIKKKGYDIIIHCLPYLCYSLDFVYDMFNLFV